MSRRRTILFATVVGFLAGAASATAAWTANTTATGTLTAALEFPPLTVTIPTIVGVAQDGQTLKVDLGTYSPAATSATYEWLRCDSAGANCTAIGTSATQLLALADITKTIRVRVTPKNGAMPGPAVLSEATTPTNAIIGGAPTLALVASPLPAISGTLAVGQLLTANDGQWLSLLGIGSRQWLRCDDVGASCADIAGATGIWYTPVAADRGKRLRLRVTATGVLGLGGKNVATSLATEKVT
ncbi:hypothetical protein OJ997_09065 [Solirubrobacter phytolaccae]|uniref:Uncharacterized protein n=1 Tax=Solirubrobacter phytolaccae TaxID=1404360 RepID=A0A9X3S8K9_9ACTN|nr:hypothetical protein [Solirubrobacter phytolaccae]MDA0180441.1 hypothetical protein [Solirubrobacter phytolaccae]